MKPSDIFQEYKYEKTRQALPSIAGGTFQDQGFDSIVYVAGDNVLKFAIGRPGEHTRKAIRGLSQYLRVIKRVPSNPAYPKIDLSNSGIKRIGPERIFVLQMEKLNILSHMEKQFVSWLYTQLGGDDRSEHSKTWEEVLEILTRMHAANYIARFWRLLTTDQKQMWQNVYETMFGLKLEAIKRELDLDMHSENFMKRNDGQIVITDPFVKDRYARIEAERVKEMPFNFMETTLDEYKDPLTPELWKPDLDSGSVNMGADSAVVVDPKKGKATKYIVGGPFEPTSRAISGFIPFYRFLKANPDNPALPKIVEPLRLKRIGTDRVGIVGFEELKPLRDNQRRWLIVNDLIPAIVEDIPFQVLKSAVSSKPSRAAKILVNEPRHRYALMRVKEVKNSPAYFEKMFENWYETGRKLNKYIKSIPERTKYYYKFDLHTRNVMLRSWGDLVWSDPIIKTHKWTK